MSLVEKRDNLIHVPWFSVEEWLQVYKNIYSGDSSCQKEAYEMLLVWKARMSILPIGVECTLGLLQASLRDQEWTPQIYSGQKPLTYEKDLQSIYSMAIMKFLNHMPIVHHDKQTSLFDIAKNFNIPDWIVNLRHDTAHGSELPSIDVMRIVSNKLLAWVHEEYWAAEARHLQVHELDDIEKIISEEEGNLNKLFELWVAINLYIKTDHQIISDIPDQSIKDNLNLIWKKLNLSNAALNSGITLHEKNDDLKLSIVSNCLFDGISKILSKTSSFSTTGKVIIDLILNSEAFLAAPEFLKIFEATTDTIDQKNHLPVTLIEFWKDILRLLQDKKILISLCIQMIEFVNKENDNRKILLASLWVKTLLRSFLKLNVSKQIYQSLEQKFNHNKVEILPKNLIKLVKEEIDLSYPDLKEVPDLNIFSDFPSCLNDRSYFQQLVTNNSKEVVKNYIVEIVELSDVVKNDPIKKAKLLNLLGVNPQTDVNMVIDASDDTHEDTNEISLTENTEMNIQTEKLKSLEKNLNEIETFADNEVRNTKWKIADDSENHDWSNCPIGILPWQMNTPQTLSSLIVSPSKVRHAVARSVNLPRILDSNGIRLHTKIQWEELEEKRRRKKRQNVLKQQNK
ncbi:uncharacterized protein LOC106655020 [Trichogramma pretiosum]|uniref:uncharacterized protein LOC106655020 n=1 Tax=Trichogramma pretiosum TaxID=7493 RepID=UPI0006C9B01E|nr:uncharacterized protein LOC106655020 [Trichogramma pretiosum]